MKTKILGNVYDAGERRSQWYVVICPRVKIPASVSDSKYDSPILLARRFQEDRRNLKVPLLMKASLPREGLCPIGFDWSKYRHRPYMWPLSCFIFLPTIEFASGELEVLIIWKPSDEPPGLYKLDLRRNYSRLESHSSVALTTGSNILDSFTSFLSAEECCRRKISEPSACFWSSNPWDILWRTPSQESGSTHWWWSSIFLLYFFGGANCSAVTENALLFPLGGTGSATKRKIRQATGKFSTVATVEREIT